MAKRKRKTAGEYRQRLKDLELERFLRKKDKQEGIYKPKKKRKKKKQKPVKKHDPKAAWKAKYYKYLQSPEWAAIRIEILNDRKCCERCGSKIKLVVHHKSYDNVFKEEPEDLELLCKVCHEEEHGI
jgi:5-methylcytosine-specific restriction endonuclease McrA